MGSLKCLFCCILGCCLEKLSLSGMFPLGTSCSLCFFRICSASSLHFSSMVCFFLHSPACLFFSSWVCLFAVPQLASFSFTQLAACSVPQLASFSPPILVALLCCSYGLCLAPPMPVVWLAPPFAHNGGIQSVFLPPLTDI